MARSRTTSTITHGRLKFRPVHDRGTREEHGRIVRYWRCSEYLGREGGKAIRRSYPALWAAEEDLPEVAARYARGETERALPDARATVEEFSKTATAGMILQAWLTYRLSEEAASLAKNTVGHARLAVGATKELAFRRVRASAVGKQHLAALVRDLRKRYAASSVVGFLRVYSLAWRWAYDRGFVPRPLNTRDQVVQLRKLAARDPAAAGVGNHYTPTVEQAKRVGQWFVAQNPGRGGWPKIAYLLLLSTGCRGGALQWIQWRHLKLAEQEDGPAVVHLPRTKTGPRDVYVGETVLRQVLALRPATVRDDDPVLMTTSRAGRRPVKTIREQMGRYIAKACVAAKVPVFTPHGLRRLAVRQAVRHVMASGGSISAAAKQMGHTVEVMLEHYEAATVEEQRAAAAMMDYAVIPPPAEGEVVPLRPSKPA